MDKTTCVLSGVTTINRRQVRADLIDTVLFTYPKQQQRQQQQRKTTKIKTREQYRNHHQIGHLTQAGIIVGHYKQEQETGDAECETRRFGERITTETHKKPSRVTSQEEGDHREKPISVLAMANRRLLDSSSHRTIATSNCCQTSKASLLILALISCLISINCASFDRRSAVNNKRWQAHPVYTNLYNGLAKEDPDFADELFGPPNPLFGEDSKQQSPMLDERQSQASAPTSYYLPVAPSRSSHAANSHHSEPANQLYRQLLLDPYLADNDQSLAYQPDTIDDNNQPKSDSIAYINDPDFNAKLDELFRADKKFLSRAADSNNELEQSRDLSDQYSIETKAPSYFQSLLFPLDQSRELSEVDSNDKITFGQKQDQPQHLSTGEQEGQDKDVYNVEEDNRPFGQKLNGGQTGDEVETIKVETKKDNQKQSNWTTLLEDDEAVKDETIVIANSTSNTTLQVEANTQSSFGSNVQSYDHSRKPEQTTTSSQKSMLGRMYEKLTSYLPSFKGALNWFKFSPSADHQPVVSVYRQPLSDDSKIMSQVSEKRDLQQQQHQATANSEVNTKPSVSALLEPSTIAKDQGDSNVVAGAAVVVDYNDKQSNNNDRRNERKKSNSIGPSDENSYNYNENDNVGGRQSPVNTDNEGSGHVTRTVGNSISVHAPIHEIEIKERLPNVDNKVNLLRSSSLVMPFKSNDELVVQTSSANAEDHPESLLGKYIYAPHHHYHLNTLAPGVPVGNPDGAMLGVVGDAKSNEHMFSKMSLRSYSRRYRPDDEIDDDDQVAYGPYRYAGQGPLGLVANKTNDVYFLMMVGAFCVMAMAVVLAAGLFAYRVQQSRKTSSDADYPTYGVVGPNNMSGKCGAGSFVGGYFASGGPGSSSSGSKAGSTKHLADLYSASGDSGIASGGKPQAGHQKKANEPNSNGNNNNNFMANQNAARMYHYQHQKQQMIISDRTSNGRHTSASDLDSEDENDDGNYTVYECPGLASAHEMEIKNPLFNDDHSP